MPMYYEIHSIAEYLECLKTLSKDGVDGYQNENTRLYFRGEPADYGATAGQPGIARGKWLRRPSRRGSRWGDTGRSGSDCGRGNAFLGWRRSAPSSM